MTEPVAPANDGVPVRPGGAAEASAAKRPRSPWPIAIVIGLILVAIVNLVFIVIAVRGGEPVVESYSTGQR